MIKMYYYLTEFITVSLILVLLYQYFYMRPLHSHEAYDLVTRPFYHRIIGRLVLRTASLHDARRC